MEKYFYKLKDESIYEAFSQVGIYGCFDSYEECKDDFDHYYGQEDENFDEYEICKISIEVNVKE